MLSFCNRINPANIIGNHFCTFYDNRTMKLDRLEIFFVVTIPFLLAAAATYHGYYVTDGVAGMLFNGFSITGGFLINALVLLAEKREEKADATKIELKKLRLLRETSYNAGFGIIVAFSAVTLCAIYPMIGNHNSIASLGVSFLICYLGLLFLHTLLMVLKRLSSIFAKDFAA